MKINSIVYNDIYDDYSSWNAYRGDHEFSWESLSDKVKDSLLIGEVSYTSFSRNEFGEVYDKMLHDLSSYILNRSHVYMFLLEHRVQLKSRIRSYKGLFHKQIFCCQEDLIEVEFDISKNKSIMAGLMHLDRLNASQLHDGFSSAPNSFLLLSEDESIFSSDFVDSVMSNCLYYSGDLAYIDYAKTVEHLSDKKTMLVRLAGDSSEYVSIQFFDSSKRRSELAMELTLVRGDK